MVAGCITGRVVHFTAPAFPASQLGKAVVVVAPLQRMSHHNFQCFESTRSASVLLETQLPVHVTGDYYRLRVLTRRHEFQRHRCDGSVCSGKKQVNATSSPVKCVFAVQLLFE